MRRILALWWIPFAVALAAVIGWETDWGDALFKPVEVPPPPLARTLSPSLLPEYKAATEPELYAEVIDRPLFSPTRRQAPPPPPPETPKPQMVTGQYALTGTVQVGDKLYAFLRGTRDGKGVRAAQGDILAGGIKLAKVEPGRVVLTQYDSEEEVRLQVSKSTGRTPTAAPMPQPGQPPVAGQPGGPSVPVPGMPGGIPGVAGIPTPQGGMVSANPPVVPQVQEVPVQGQSAPAVPGMAPFVPGVSNSNPVPPRRRGAMQ